MGGRTVSSLPQCRAIVELLEERLHEFNVATTRIADGQGLGLFVRDARGELIAAAAGHTWGETCELKQVWVHPESRRQGLGRRLIEAAVAEAERRGCRQLVLSTHSFQAPEFYRKLGFEEVGRLADYPRGHAQVFMRKPLRGVS